MDANQKVPFLDCVESMYMYVHKRRSLLVAHVRHPFKRGASLAGTGTRRSASYRSIMTVESIH